MRNTLLKKYFSYFIILINNKLSKNNENMRNENEKSSLEAAEFFIDTFKNAP